MRRTAQRRRVPQQRAPRRLGGGRDARRRVRAGGGSVRADHGTAGGRRRHARGQGRPAGDGGQLVARAGGIERATDLDVAGAIIDHVANQVAFPELDVRQRLSISTGYGVAEILVREGGDFVGGTIAQAGLRDRDITVLTMHRDTEVIPNPRENRVLHANDRLLCFGNLEAMRGMIPARRRRRAKVRKLPEFPLPTTPDADPPTRHHPAMPRQYGSARGRGRGCRRRSGRHGTVVGAVAKHTPVITSVALSGDRRAGEVVLEGGEPAAHRLVQDPRRDQQGGVAGESARTRRHHRQRRQSRPGARVRRRHFGVPCEIVVPVGAPVNKIEACRNYGATVIEHGAALNEAVALSTERAAANGTTFCPPFDDVAVIAGQGTLGLELLDDIERLRTIVVPLGGGGLASGVAIAVKSAAPPRACGRCPGQRVRAVLRRLGGRRSGADVGRRDRREASGRDHRSAHRDLGRRDRHCRRGRHRRRDGAADGSGQAGRRGRRSGRRGGADRRRSSGRPTTASPASSLSGGNVDLGLVPGLIRRRENQAGRRLSIFARIDDRPGRLARLLSVFAEGGADLIEVEHLREGLDLHVRETGIHATFAIRTREQARRTRGVGAPARVRRACRERAGSMTTVGGSLRRTAGLTKAGQ